MSVRAVAQKIARLRAGGRPRVLDLFAGCGGLSLGFQAAGFELRAALELDPDAARSHGLNFHGGAPEHSQARDITVTHPEDLVDELNLGPVDMAIDVIVGGPPCQAFARVGRSKLREIEEHPEAFKHDPRARLYQEYLRYVTAFKPLAVLMENVPDVLNHGGQNIAEEICEVLEDKDYICGYTLLNAGYYGVPQTRERMFLIAYRREITSSVEFPEPTHWVGLPPGYDGTRAVALKLLNQGTLLGVTHGYIRPPEASRKLPAAVTAEEAIGDLPPIYAREEMEAGTLRRGARRFDVPLPYDRRRKVSAFARLMRSWPGFAAPEFLRDHVVRYLPRDYRTFIAKQLKLTAPTADEERTDPRRANDFYLSAGNWLREHTRDTRTFSILFGENITYGYRRNLLGLKVTALICNALVAAICAAILYFRPAYFAALPQIDEKMVVIMAAVLLHSAYLLLAVSKAGVREASRAYGRQLILSCEVLMKKGRPSPQTANRKNNGSG